MPKLIILPVICMISIILFVVSSVLFDKILIALKLWKLGMDKPLDKAKELVSKGKYREALQLLNTSELYFFSYRMKPDERHEVTELWITCQEKLGEIQVAVVELAQVLTSYIYDSDIELWSQCLLDKWIVLYKSCPPIHISKFYFDEEPEEPSMLLGTIALLSYAIEEKKCQSPVGFDEEEWVIQLANSPTEKSRKIHQTLLGNMVIGDALFWLGGKKTLWRQAKYHAIVERKNGFLEKIRISEQEYRENTESIGKRVRLPQKAS